MFGKFKNKTEKEKQSTHGQQSTDHTPHRDHHQRRQSATTDVYTNVRHRCKRITVTGTHGLVPPRSPRIWTALGFTPSTSFAATGRATSVRATTALANGRVQCSIARVAA